MPTLSVTQKRHCRCGMRLMELCKCYMPHAFVVFTEQMEHKQAEEMAMPLGKKRVLPDWMVGAGKRVGVGVKKKKKVPPKVVAAPVKVTRTVMTKSATKTKAKTKRNLSRLSLRHGSFISVLQSVDLSK